MKSSRRKDRNMANKVHVVPHFHWDREWYFTAEESKILLVNDMEEILEILETREDYPYFVLDGQTSVLEDYFSVMPQMRERVANLVKSGKLIIGPWYTQTDEMVVGGESIVRNLLYGLKDCREFGPAMQIGYLPDSFGQCARMPQILNGFDISRSMFWRGTSERMGTDKTEFLWKDEEGSQVMVQLLPLGYAIGKYLPDEKEGLETRMSKYLPVLDGGATTDHILLPNGHDQMPVQKDIYQVMDLLKQSYPEKDFFLSNYESVFEEIEKNPDPAVLQGEFLDGKYMRVHRSIYSSRADLKASNTRIENKITNILEPLASIAYQLGFEYHHGLLEAIWKELMKNHAHDSIGCCCSDKVHRAIADRFFLAEERTDRLIEFYMRKIADAMGGDEAPDRLTVFNLLPVARKEVIQGEIITKRKNFNLKKAGGTWMDYELVKTEIVDAGLIDRQIVHYGDYDPFIRYTVQFYDEIPSMGYETYLIEAADLEKQINLKPDPQYQMENEYVLVQLEENGTLTLTDKQNGMVYSELLLLEDGSDDGDGYDFSPLEDDFIVTSREEIAQISCETSRFIQRAEIVIHLAIPKNLESRKKKQRDGSMEVRLLLELRKGSPVLGVKVLVDNRAEDHRLRLLLPNRQPADCSISDNQFGRIHRPVRDAAMDVWEQEHWSERPDSIYPFLSYVTTNAPASLACITNSVREYEVIGDRYDSIAVTIFRSVGVLGKENLFRRPGRPSGIKMETPDSQLLGSHSYEIGITTRCENLAKRAKEYLTPLVSFNKIPYHAMKLNQGTQITPYTFSLMEEKDGNAILSALKKSEYSESLIARFYNAEENSVNLELHMGIQMQLDEVGLNEDNVRRDDISPNQIISPNQVKTYRITPKQ